MRQLEAYHSGRGAVGGLIGAALAHEGDRVTVLVRPESLARHPRHLCLERLSGKIEAPIRLDTKLSAVVDVLCIAVKAHQLVPALNAIPPESPRIAMIVLLLNGIEHVKLKHLHAERLLGCPRVHDESNPIVLAFFLVNVFHVRMQWPSQDRRRRWRHR